MSITGFNVERDKGISKITIKDDGQPTIPINKYINLVRTLIAEANRTDIGAVLMTGSSGKFLFGGDLSEIDDLKSPSAARGATAYIQDLLIELESVPAVLISAIDGICFGGGFELILCFHIILATPSSSFGLPEIKAGTIPSYGGTQRLPRIVGRNRALKVLLTGESFPAETALKWGLVAELVSREELIPSAMNLAKKIAGLSRLALAALLQSVVGGLDTFLASGLSLESMKSSQLAGGEDLEEGISAFFQKRKPIFPSTL